MVSVDLFAGIGGWSLASARISGPKLIGAEIDPDVVRTRSAAHLLTIRTNLLTYPPPQISLDLLCASPPCQSFSSQGTRTGITSIPALCEDISARRWDISKYDYLTATILVVGKWITTTTPAAIALEQVQTVQPIWHVLANLLSTLGYSTWTGVLNAADYGVPQTRKRALLLASRNHEVYQPRPTHAKTPNPARGILPWIPMSQALAGTGAIYTPEQSWVQDRPATTVIGDRRIWPPGRKHSAWDVEKYGPNPPKTLSDRKGTHAIRLKPSQALLLQSFPEDYPVYGYKRETYNQIGNAIPPKLASAALQAVL